MPVITQTTMKGHVEIARGLDRVRRSLTAGDTAQLGHAIGREGLRLVKQLTPRQRNTVRAPYTRRGHPPLWKGWQLVEKITSTASYEGRIRNTAVDTGGFIALASVEFGARPHTIVPRGGERARLVWIQSGSFRLFGGRSAEGGDVIDTFQVRDQEPGKVWARRVNHPGHAGFHMVSQTVAQLERFKVVMLAVFARKIEQRFVGLGAGFRADFVPQV